MDERLSASQTCTRADAWKGYLARRGGGQCCGRLQQWGIEWQGLSPAL